MKAVLFAAGLGTRLHPYTSDKPKALVSIQGRPMLYRVMDKLVDAGIRDFVVNVHAFAHLVETALEQYAASRPGINIEVSDERALLLETGGGLKKMEALLKEGPFLVHNVDVLSDIDLKAFAAEAVRLLSSPFSIAGTSHELASARSSLSSSLSDLGRKPEQETDREQLPLAVLAVRKSFSDRCFLLDQQNLLCGWENKLSGEQKISRKVSGMYPAGFMGIHCISASIFKLIEEEGIFSITDLYLRLARTYPIVGLDQSASRWMDIGSPEQLLLAEKEF